MALARVALAVRRNTSCHDTTSTGDSIARPICTPCYGLDDAMVLLLDVGLPGSFIWDETREVYSSGRFFSRNYEGGALHLF